MSSATASRMLFASARLASSAACCVTRFFSSSAAFLMVASSSGFLASRFEVLSFNVPVAMTPADTASWRRVSAAATVFKECFLASSICCCADSISFSAASSAFSYSSKAFWKLSSFSSFCSLADSCSSAACAAIIMAMRAASSNTWASCFFTASWDDTSPKTFITSAEGTMSSPSSAAISARLLACVTVKLLKPVSCKAVLVGLC
mmetsp:Transcript_17398/g.39205  ORF Transcript_17398/g.39205 Transcript_17398/m.39205 type:complete len:205 (+) Transcript_17398:793-1407(+)